MDSFFTECCQLVHNPANERCHGQVPKARGLLKAVLVGGDRGAGLIGFRLSQALQQFHQARLVRITCRRIAIRLDPFGMLDPQVVVNLFPQLCVGVDLLKHDH